MSFVPLKHVFKLSLHVGQNAADYLQNLSIVWILMQYCLKMTNQFRYLKPFIVIVVVVVCNISHFVVDAVNTQSSRM